MVDTIKTDNTKAFRNSNDLLLAMGEALTRLRTIKGIVHQITNAVTIHECANAVLAIGTFPIMASHVDEVVEVTARSKSLVLNLGKIESETERSMLAAGESAVIHQVPIVLDPVGVGATKLRYGVVMELLEKLYISVIRCNVNELLAIYKTDFHAPGVDSLDALKETTVVQAAKMVAKKYHNIVAVTGQDDYVTNGDLVVKLSNGNPLLPRLTGTGCMTSSLVGSFLTAANPFIAAIAGISYMSIAGELAAKRMNVADGLGSFSIYLHDALSLLDQKQIVELAKVEIL